MCLPSQRLSNCSILWLQLNHGSISTNTNSFFQRTFTYFVLFCPGYHFHSNWGLEGRVQRNNAAQIIPSEVPQELETVGGFRQWRCLLVYPLPGQRNCSYSSKGANNKQFWEFLHLAECQISDTLWHTCPNQILFAISLSQTSVFCKRRYSASHCAANWNREK